jgi:hypothetical protein
MMTHDDWIRFLGRALLLAPIVDPRYIAHRLIDGFAVLRISTNPAKQKLPELVDFL